MLFPNYLPSPTCDKVAWYGDVGVCVCVWLSTCSWEGGGEVVDHISQIFVLWAAQRMDTVLYPPLHCSLSAAKVGD